MRNSYNIDKSQELVFLGVENIINSMYRRLFCQPHCSYIFRSLWCDDHWSCHVTNRSQQRMWCQEPRQLLVHRSLDRPHSIRAESRTVSLLSNTSEAAHQLNFSQLLDSQGNFVCHHRESLSQKVKSAPSLTRCQDHGCGQSHQPSTLILPLLAHELH